VDHLEPWPTWKAFKAFLQREVTGVCDTVSFQCEHQIAEGESARFLVYLVRQFTERAGGEETNGDDELVGRLVVELQYPRVPPGAGSSVEVWALDFPNNTDWASVVEGLPDFQEAMARAPDATSVYYEACDP
jgi:hypothetical protein